MQKYVKIFKDGIITENPVLVQLVGMCPTLAISTTLQNAIGMGIAATFVLVFSNIVISALRRVTPNKIRIAVFVVVIAGFVTIVDLLMQAFAPDLSKSLGIFIPLIVVNCIIIARAEAFAQKNAVLPSALDGIAMGIGFTLALCVLSAIREILGNGTIGGYPLFGNGFQPALLMLFAPWGFLTLGVMIAVIQKIKEKKGA